MALREKIQALKQVTKMKPGGILSIYLDTDRSSPEQQQGQWKVRLKNGLKKLEEYLDVQGAMDEKSQFKHLAKEVEKEIHHLQRRHQKGLILYASHDLKMWEVEILQVKVDTEFFWEEKPRLEQLENINNHYPPCGIIVGQSDQVRILDTALGQILDEVDYRWNIIDESWVHSKQIDSPSGNFGSPSSYKNLLPTLQREAKKRKWEEVYLVGHTSFIQCMKDSLQHIPVINTVPKNFKTESSHDLLSMVI